MNKQRKNRARLLRIESLDQRLCLAANLLSAEAIAADTTHVSRWHNVAKPHDVNRDGRVTPSDALAIINSLNTHGPRSLASLAGESGSSSPMLDVNGDQQVTAIDCLSVINELNERSSEAATAASPENSSTSSDQEIADPEGISQEQNNDEPITEPVESGDTSSNDTVDPDGISQEQNNDEPVTEPVESGDTSSNDTVDPDGISQEQNNDETVTDPVESGDTSTDSPTDSGDTSTDQGTEENADTPVDSGDTSTDDSENSEETPDERPTDDEAVDSPDECHRPRPRLLERAFEEFDDNSDGVLSEEEVSAEIWGRIVRADADGSGGVTLEELLDELAEHRPGRGPHHRGDMFERFDANDDGLLSADEVSDALWERISGADANGDELVSAEELADFRPRHNPLERLFDRLDANADGGLTVDEVPERLWERIESADADDDGSVTQDELRGFVVEQIPAPARVVRNVVEQIGRIRARLRR